MKDMKVLLLEQERKAKERLGNVDSLLHNEGTASGLNAVKW